MRTHSQTSSSSNKRTNFPAAFHVLDSEMGHSLPGAKRLPSSNQMRSGFSRVYQWKPYLKSSVTALRSNLNVTTKLFHDRQHSVNPKARSLANPLRREKGVKDVWLSLGWNSGAVIADLNHDIVVLAKGPYPKFTLTLHGGDGVFDDVGPDLIRLSSGRVSKK